MGNQENSNWYYERIGDPDEDIYNVYNSEKRETITVETLDEKHLDTIQDALNGKAAEKLEIAIDALTLVNEYFIRKDLEKSVLGIAVSKALESIKPTAAIEQ